MRVDARAIDDVAPCRMLAVDRRRERRDRVLLRRAALGQRLTAVQHRLELLREEIVGRVGFEVERDHRAFEHGAARRRAVEQQAIAVDGDRLFPDVSKLRDQCRVAGVLLRRPQAARERLDVAHGSRREFPVVVNGKLDRGRLRMVPRRTERLHQHGLPQSAQAPAIECRHDTRDVVLARLEPARTDQPRDVALLKLLHLGSESGFVRFALLRHGLCVRPQPRFGEIGQLGRGLLRGERNGRQRTPRLQHRRTHQCAFHHDERKPRPQMVVGVRLRRCEQPREIGRIEVDDREIVGLEVGDVRLGIGADHEPRIDADDVGRPVEREVHIARDRGNGIAILLRLQRKTDAYLRTRRERGSGRIGVAVRARKSAPRPGHESIRDAHATSASSAT